MINVRELENVIERAMILYREEPLRFNLMNQEESSSVSLNPQVKSGDFPTLDEIIKTHIQRALAETNGQIHGKGAAGELLKVNPNTLRHKMKKHGIPLKNRII